MSFFKGVGSNDAKIERIALRRRDNERSFEEKQERHVKLVLNKAESIVREQSSALIREKDRSICVDVMGNIVNAVVLRSLDGPQQNTYYNLAEEMETNDKENDALVDITKKRNIGINSRQHADLSWSD